MSGQLGFLEIRTPCAGVTHLYKARLGENCKGHFVRMRSTDLPLKGQMDLGIGGLLQENRWVSLENG